MQGSRNCCQLKLTNTKVIKPKTSLEPRTDARCHHGLLFTYQSKLGFRADVLGNSHIWCGDVNVKFNSAQMGHTKKPVASYKIDWVPVLVKHTNLVPLNVIALVKHLHRGFPHTFHVRRHPFRVRRSHLMR